jgi:glycerol-3-phosphate dehydrogenase
VTPAEELEVLDLVKRALPHASLEREAVVSVWSGVRPLVRPPGVSADDTVELARTHRIIAGEPGVFAIVGGKLTTYRQMAQDMVDELVSHFDRSGFRPEGGLRPCITAARPLVPGDLDIEGRMDAPTYARFESLIADLLPRHGAFTELLVQRVDQQPELGAPLVEQLPYRRVEVIQAIEAEGVTRLVDLLRRRLPLALTDPNLGWRVAPELARVLADHWGGDQAFIDRELEHYRDELISETSRDPVGFA